MSVRARIDRLEQRNGPEEFTPRKVHLLSGADGDEQTQRHALGLADDDMVIMLVGVRPSERKARFNVDRRTKQEDTP
jgi:hypothetical protein